MALIKGRDTKPEMAVRRFLHGRGLRFRLHGKGLPGKPDMVFRPRKTVVFVHGCFWHGCPYCKVGARQVRSNVAYWSAKVMRNKDRDIRNQTALEDAGWTVLTIWSCQIRPPGNLEALESAIRARPRCL